MAAPTDTGYGETVELEKGSTGLGLSAEDPIGFDDVKNGGDHEDVQVAKKARVEKAVNGEEEDVDDDEGVESVEKELDPELDPLLAHNGTAADESEERINGEGDDEEEEDSVGAAAEDEPADDGAPAAVTSKDASSGDVGLRTLLQEGDTTKASLVNGTEVDASHLLNGAK
jgi:hypothetical protein